MRGGVVAILFGFILVLIIAIVALTVVSGTRKSAEENVLPVLEQIFEPVRPYTFDISNYLVDFSQPVETNRMEYFSNPGNFCTKLKQCLLTSIRQRGIPCDIGIVDYGSGTFDSSLKSFMARFCADGPVREKLEGGLRTVCDFEASKQITTDPFWENQTTNVLSAAENPFYAKEPWIHGCWFERDFNWPLTNREYIYSPPYYYDAPTHVGNFEFEGTGGKQHIVLQNGTVNADGTCSYNLFICGQPAIGSTEYNLTAQLFKLLYADMEREMGCDEYTVFPYSGCTPVVPYGYMPHYYELQYGADEKGNLNAIIAALDAAFWEWTRENYDNSRLAKSWPRPLMYAKGAYFNYAPWTTSAVAGSSASDSTCSKILVPGGVIGIPVSQPTLFYYSGDNFATAKMIRLSIGVRKTYDVKDAYGGGTGNNGVECGKKDEGWPISHEVGVKCGEGDTCVDSSKNTNKCCQKYYSSYEQSAGKCWADKVLLTPTVQVCAYS